MRETRGEYFLFLDFGDFFNLDMLEKLYRRAKMDQLDIAICGYNLYDDTNRETNFTKFQIFVGWAWDKLFRSTFVKECGYLFPEFPSSEDRFFVYMFMARAKKMRMISERLVFHRINNRNSLSNTKELNWENGFKILQLTAEELQHQEIYSVYEKSFVGFAIEFQVWYLQSMHEKEAFYKCYTAVYKFLTKLYLLAIY